MLSKKRGYRKLKRAISPLIAAVLLLAFSIVLGGIIMGWGQSFTEEKADEALLSGQLQVNCQITTALGIKTVASNKRLCYKNVSQDGGQLEFTLENKGSDDIAGVKVIIIGVNDTTQIHTFKDFEIIGGGIAKGNASFNFTAFGSTVRQADFIPMVEVDSATGAQLCRNIKLEEDGIFECT